MCGDRETKAVATIVGGYFGGPTGAMAANAIAASTISNNPVPPLQATPVMPVANQQDIARQREMSIARMLQSGGRASTILSQPTSQTLGG